MKKKLILILVAALVVTLGIYAGYRFAKRGTDIIGGALFGIIVGWLVWLLTGWIEKKYAHRETK